MILANSSLIDFIDSDDMKKYYIDNKIDIKYDLIFFMIYNSNKPLYKKLNGFATLMNIIESCFEQDDDSKYEVSDQIAKMHRRIHFILNEMAESAIDGESYDLEYCLNGEWMKKSFSSFTNALQYLKNSIDKKCKYAKIVKNKVGDTKYVTVINPKTYELSTAFSFGSDHPELYPEGPIEERYFPIPSPFKKGDIVKINASDHILQLNYKDPSIIYIISEEERKDIQYAEEGEIDECGFRVDQYDCSTGLLNYNDDRVSPFKIEYDKYDYDEDFMNIRDRIISLYSKYLKGENVPFMSIIPEIEKEILRIHGIKNDIIV